MSDQPRKWGGFTLIEVMAVVALIGFVFFVALNFYTDLSDASTRAADHTHGVRRASAILDRVARDLEGVMLLVKPAEMDPLAFPWLFLGEARLGGDASERLKFITRNHDPTRTDAAETNLATVAYVVESRPDDSVALYRWSSPHLPDGLDKNFPRADDDGSFLLAEDLGSFGFSFLGEDGELRGEWDSSTLLESSSLPVAVDIQLTMMTDRDSEEAEAPVYRRRVLIPIRPLDLVALADPNDPIFGSGKEDAKESEGDEDEESDEGEDGSPSGDGGGYTNKDCFPAVPASAPPIAHTCKALADSAPDMAFTRRDYDGMPDGCKPYVNPICTR